MKKSRIWLAGVAALALAAPAIADTCAFPGERAALELNALQSHLAVVAIRCQQDATYASFVRRHQADLTAAGRTAQTHFRRAYGGQGAARYNMYSTELINAHDQEAQRFEGFLCRDNAALYQQAVAAPNAAELVRMANTTNILMTYEPAVCPATPARAARPARRQR
ncbi:hypothetical protein [Plastoroseomonas arctica]|uniref:Uncharacterized protein n=1 Tax=Plastoroseomonas arctica TaxID=1509237 RepID=A0AAF1KSZ3_9PROT|nr:hypothetical protein [Plastoroseomonas arctica]MBR0655002.1 hypothetical protein [Plastoroseomonas arctica]